MTLDQATVWHRLVKGEIWRVLDLDKRLHRRPAEHPENS